MEAHAACRKEVTSLSVHPSGLLALSTSRDDMLRMWNMAKGRSQYKTKIPPGTESVSFSPNGDIYALLSGLKVLPTCCIIEPVNGSFLALLWCNKCNDAFLTSYNLHDPLAWRRSPHTTSQRRETLPEPLSWRSGGFV